MATALGVVLFLSPETAFVLVVLFAVVVYFTRYVSLGSLCAAAGLLVLLLSSPAGAEGYPLAPVKDAPWSHAPFEIPADIAAAQEATERKAAEARREEGEAEAREILKELVESGVMNPEDVPPARRGRRSGRSVSSGRARGTRGSRGRLR